MNTKLLATLLLPSLLGCAWLMFVEFPAAAQHSRTNTQEEIPTVDFCEMVTHPAAYFDKTIRITAAYQSGDEGSNLNNVRCVRSHDDSIGVGFVRLDEEQNKAVNRSVGKIMSGKVGVEPRVTVVGILRNSSVHAFAWYRYRFDIIAFEDIRDDITQRIVSYDGTLQVGLTYRAMVKRDPDFGLAFAFPLRIAVHQAVRLEWINLTEFRALPKLREREQKQIVLRITSDDVQQMEPQRWNRTLQLEILLVE